MISITRAAAPAILTTKFIQEGVERFKADGHPVWDVPSIKLALLKISSSKCAYCELRLGEGAAYLEVEHFFAKKHHPDRVLDWDNLLPACKRCNGSKGSWDTAAPGQMMVDPCLMNPQKHIHLDLAYRPVGITEEGENTVIEVGLNDILRLGVLRYAIGEAFKDKLEELCKERLAIVTGATPGPRRALVRRLKILMDQCASDQPFSAVLSTVLIRSSHYEILQNSIMAWGDWDAQLDASDRSARALSLA
ncbi:hypothetical protein FHY18_000303 [Xanthomonas arboricola]|uniref:HNH endonuclease n=1 Tax=Xanthomonas sp. 3793 TaxID=3035312 RepID=UPI002167212C|nr:HNH endonuclease [Xanthomonas sp. 3793]MCS3744773.1 hypothetical protein [Xanthomonas sp. 3793]